jgi:hypothetical protein
LGWVGLGWVGLGWLVDFLLAFVGFCWLFAVLCGGGGCCSNA